MSAIKGGRRDTMSTVLFMLKCLLLSYVVTGGLLLLLAFLLYRLTLTEKIVNICIIFIYIISSFLAGFICGKKFGTRKFLWGVFTGLLYFLILFLVSLVVKKSFADLSSDFLFVLMLCGGSGMLGGMVS